MRFRFSLGCRPSPAFVVSLVALFVALGGTTYAATSLPKNSVGTAQLKNRAVTKTKISPKAIRALKGARGPQGPPGAGGVQGPPGPKGDTGAPGQNALRQVAGRVAFDGSIHGGSGFAVTHPATGEYDITFTTDFTDCLVNMEVTPVSAAAGAYTALSGCTVKVFTFGTTTGAAMDNNFQFLATQD